MLQSNMVFHTNFEQILHYNKKKKYIQFINSL
jgi:hypothetical protein